MSSLEIRKTIKCSQCEAEFTNGFDYRMHWEVHLDKFFNDIKYNKIIDRLIYEISSTI